MPHPLSPYFGLTQLCDSFDEIRRRRAEAWRQIVDRRSSEIPLAAADLQDGIGRICVLASSSRGGTTVTSELMQWQGGNADLETGRILSLPGEEKPHLILAGLAFPARPLPYDDLDREDADPARVASLLADMATELGTPMAACDDMRTYALQLYRRLLLQWPSALLEQPLGDSVDRLTSLLCARFDGVYVDDEDNRRRVLEVCVECFGPGIGPSFYDRSPERRNEHATVYAGDWWSVEETPFVVPPPWRNARPSDLAGGCLLLRDPSNAWRLPFWRTVFSAQEIVVLHLVRDPRETIQGLCDGWNHPWGFQTIPSAMPLDIAGYSDDADPGSGWKRHRLNFSIDRHLSDLLLRERRPMSLVQVCASQWANAHSSVIDQVRRLGLRAHRLNFADLRDAPVRSFHEVCEAIGLDESESGTRFAESFPKRWVMATSRDPRRWAGSRYAGEIGAVFSSRGIVDLSKELGL